MKLACALLFLACASCASTAFIEGSGRARARSAGVLPEPSGPLVFPAGASEVRLEWLLQELARLTGHELVVSESAALGLAHKKERLEALTPVPTAEVYPFVESILIANDFCLAAGPAGDRPVLHIVELGMGPRPTFSYPVLPLSLAQRDELQRHPALLFQIVMTFQNIDTRQLQTQLRQLLVDPSGVVNCVPAGERSLLLSGYGYKLSGLIGLLEEVDRASAARQTQAEQAAAPR